MSYSQRWMSTQNLPIHTNFMIWRGLSSKHTGSKRRTLRTDIILRSGLKPTRQENSAGSTSNLARVWLPCTIWCFRRWYRCSRRMSNTKNGDHWARISEFWDAMLKPKSAMAPTSPTWKPQPLLTKNQTNSSSTRPQWPQPNGGQETWAEWQITPSCLHSW